MPAATTTYGASPTLDAPSTDRPAAVAAASIALTEGGSHFPMVEDAEQLRNTVAPWLGKNTEGRQLPSPRSPRSQPPADQDTMWSGAIVTMVRSSDQRATYPSTSSGAM